MMICDTSTIGSAVLNSKAENPSNSLQSISTYQRSLVSPLPFHRCSINPEEGKKCTFPSLTSTTQPSTTRCPCFELTASAYSTTTENGIPNPILGSYKLDIYKNMLGRRETKVGKIPFPSVFSLSQ